ncbi:MAG: phage baseplate assembly protein V [Pseudomonadota bacterium]
MRRAPGLDVEELARRLDNLVRIGSITDPDYAAATARVSIGGVETAQLPFMTTRAGPDRTWWAPETGEQVIVMAPSGDPEQGFILPGAIYQDAHPAPDQDSRVHRVIYDDGADIAYDRAAHRLTVTLPAGAEIDVTATGGVTINGDLVVTGDVTADGPDGVSLIDHVHGGVTAGSSLTDKPEN